jgi:putative flippase GtrA
MSDSQNTFAVRLGAAARRRDSWLQLLKFGVVGGSGYLINLGVFAFLSGNLGVYHVVAAVGAFCVAVTSNFLWNRYWTFGPGEGLAHMQAARFLAVSVGCLVINLVVLELLVASGMSELGGQAIAVAVAMPFNFLGNKLWTFA